MWAKTFALAKIMPGAGFRSYSSGMVCLDVRTSAVNDRGEMAAWCWRFEPVPFPAADPSAKRRRGDSEVSHHVWEVLARIHPSAASVQPSIHPCMHACVHPVGKAQANRFTDVCAKGYLDWRELPELQFLSDEFCYGPWQWEYQGSKSSPVSR